MRTRRKEGAHAEVKGRDTQKSSSPETRLNPSGLKFVEICRNLSKLKVEIFRNLSKFVEKKSKFVDSDLKFSGDHVEICREPFPPGPDIGRTIPAKRQLFFDKFRPVSTNFDIDPFIFGENRHTLGEWNGFAQNALF